MELSYTLIIWREWLELAIHTYHIVRVHGAVIYSYHMERVLGAVVHSYHMERVHGAVVHSYHMERVHGAVVHSYHMERVLGAVVHSYHKVRVHGAVIHTYHMESAWNYQSLIIWWMHGASIWISFQLLLEWQIKTNIFHVRLHFFHNLITFMDWQAHTFKWLMKSTYVLD